MSWTVVGDEPTFVQELVDALRSAGVEVEPTLRDQGPRVGVIVVERAGSSAPAIERDGALDEARRAVVLRGGEIVVVTDRPDADLALRALRRSGLPYTIVRNGPAVEGSEARPWVLPEALSRPVLVRRRLVRELAERIAEDGTGSGATLELGATRSGREVRDALRSGAWVLGPTSFRACAFLGLPTFDADARGRLRRWRPPRRILGRAWWPRLSSLLLLSLALAAPVHAQRVEPCEDAEPVEARGARLAALALRLSDAPDRKRASHERAVRAQAIVDAHRGAIAGLFDRLRQAAADVATGPARERLARVRLSLGDDGILPGPALGRGCGPDLLADDAWLAGSLDVVVLCPGFVVLEDEAARAAGTSDLSRRVAEASAFLLAHELGHVVESPRESPEPEARADAVAVEILRRVPEVDALTSLRSFCGLPADGAHAAGAPRIERVLGALGTTARLDLLDRGQSGAIPPEASSAVMAAVTAARTQA